MAIRFGAFLLGCALSTTVLAQQGKVDPAALDDVQKFLNDPKAREEAGRKDPKAAQVEAFFRKFPPYAQTELNEIVMMIMTESGEDAIKHAKAHQQGGAQGAMNSFSPAVRARVEALQKRLMGDPQFNSPANVQMMKSFMPAFLGQAGS